MPSRLAEIIQIPCLSDNYGFIIRTQPTMDEPAKTIVIDAPDADLLLSEIKIRGFGTLDFVLNTHKHYDHIGGNQRLKALTGCAIWGPQEIQTLSPLDRILEGGNQFLIGELGFEVIDLSGHTMGLIGYYCPHMAALFVGDALFPLGCGRMFEGTSAQFWAAFERILALPPQTLIYSAHEYALSNAEFALSLDPDDQALKDRVSKIIDLRAQGLPSVPSLLIDEIKTNPFITHPLKKPAIERAACFGDLRALKDRYQTTGQIKI